MGRTARALAGALLVAAFATTGCGLEHEILGPATDEGHTLLPQPSDTVLRGMVSALPGADVRFFTASGSRVVDAEAAADEQGAFQQRFGGAESYRGLLTRARSGGRVYLGVLDELPAQPTVFHEERVVDLAAEHVGLADLDRESTAATLVLAAAADRLGVGLDALEPAAILDGFDQAWQALDDEEGAIPFFGRVVATLDQAAASVGVQDPWIDMAGLAGEESFLSRGWLGRVTVDYDGDGVADVDTAAFDAALAEAAEAVDLDVCYEIDRMRVVFHLDMRPGVRNLNCSEVDHFKWTEDLPTKSAFFTGGVHEDTPVCGPERQTHCITEAQVDEVNRKMGSWVPNTLPMWDDGSHGDAVANDGIWTVAFALPYIPTETSPDGAGLRLAYKYTFGVQGQIWTDSEEWPGNQRLLEVEDVNGDRLVVRYDIFGDEAANKDKVNTLKPSKGGCGFVEWEAERDPECAGDTRENRVDTDGDCEPDAWEDAGPVAPLTVPCQEVGEPR
ncbi:MAG: choice-of-anchor X domain-containing protein [Myxococcota bacterium]